MVAKKSIDSQLRSLGLHFRIRGRAEITELRNILQPGERIMHCLYGYYQGGSGLLVATNDRLLLVDKQPLYLHLEELAYDAIHESLIIHKLMQATVLIRSRQKRLVFRSMSDARLRKLNQYIDFKIAEIQRDIRDSAVLSDQISHGYIKHPAWRPHAPHMVRSRPAKFHRSIGQVART